MLVFEIDIGFEIVSEFQLSEFDHHCLQIGIGKFDENMGVILGGGNEKVSLKPQEIIAQHYGIDLNDLSVGTLFEKDECLVVLDSDILSPS